MYSEHFGFAEAPFGVTPDPRFFYRNTVIQEALAGLEHGIDARQAFIVVTGEAGTGKTTLLRRLISTSIDTLEYGFITNPCLSFTALLRKVLKDWGIPNSSTDRKILLEQLNNRVHEQFTTGHTVALLFDEAQALSDEVLAELQLLYRIGCDDNEKLIPIVLVGQPVLDLRLDNSNLRQIKECITLRRSLIPLQDPDVGLYVISRLEHAGYHGTELFGPAAIERLINRSSGIPRLINNICDNALLLAYRSSEHTVSADMIDEVANQLRLVERPARASQKMDDIANQLRPINLLPISDHKIDEVANQPWFVAPPVGADPKTAPESDQPEDIEIALPTESVESSNRVDDFEREVGEQVIPAIVEDSCEIIDRSVSGEQKAAPENDQPENLEDHSARESDAQSLVDEIATGSRHLRNHRLANFNWMRISIGAFIVVVVLGGGFVAFDLWSHKAVAPAVDDHVANSLGGARPVVAPEKLIDEVVVEEGVPQPVLSPPSHSPPVPQDRAQNEVGIQKQMVERENAPNIDQPPPQQIYRVSGPSFLRKRPTADAEIVETLQPGTRIAVAKSGEYFRVRSLADDRVSGFVHREDAFFELIP